MAKKASLAALLALLLALAATVAFVASRPTTYRVERSALLAAPPAVLLYEISDVREWPRWSPWEQSSTPRRRSFGGQPSTAGASYYWSAGDGSGPGRLTVDRITSLEVELELESHGRSTDMVFVLLPSGTGTQVTWSITGERRRFADRLLSVLRNPDRAIAADLERGLEGLRAVTDTQAPIAACQVERSARVAAPPAAVLAKITDLRGWGRWSPWEPAGPGNRRSYGGPQAGKGASYYWASESTGQQGRLTILEIGPDRVDLELEVAGSASDLEFRLLPEPGGTRVTWAMRSDVTGPKADPACSAAFERGLSRLKDAVEAEETALR